MSSLGVGRVGRTRTKIARQRIDPKESAAEASSRDLLQPGQFPHPGPLPHSWERGPELAYGELGKSASAQCPGPLTLAALIALALTVAPAAPGFAETDAPDSPPSADPATPDGPTPAAPPASVPSVPAVPPTQAQASDQKKLLRAPGAPPRTSIDEQVGSAGESQYFFLHDDNFFTFQVNGGSPPRAKFQFSLRFDIASLRDIHNWGFNVAFTQKSFWDMLDFNHSSPFIESNYRPEAFFSYRPKRLERFRELQLGVLHESNGLGAVGNVDQTALSRGWNYVFFDARWGINRLANGAPWFFFTPGLRVWYPFDASSRALIHAEGYFVAYVDLDVKIPSLPQASRVSARVKVRRHSVEGNVYYPLLSLTTSGAVRAWLFGQFFRGEAERLITFDERVTHVYAGIAFQ